MMALEVPRNMLVTSMFTGVPLFTASDSTARGVAELTPSKAENWVIALPKDRSRKQRPARAGLMKFLPRPPKQHFTTRMAKTEPMMG